MIYFFKFYFNKKVAKFCNHIFTLNQEPRISYCSIVNDLFLQSDQMDNKYDLRTL